MRTPLKTFLAALGAAAALAGCGGATCKDSCDKLKTCNLSSAGL